MADTWTAPAGVLTRRATGWAGIWTLTYTAGQAAMHLASVPGADDDLALTYAALDLSRALTEIEWVHPDDAATAVAVDLGTAGPSAPRVAAGVIAGLIARARQVALEAVDGDEVVVADILAVGRVTELLTAAHTKVTGGPW